MTYQNLLRNTACITALTFGGAVHADVTAEQVWDNWRDLLELYGDENLSYDVQTGNGTVTIANIVVAMSEDDESFEARVGDIILTEQGDGTVRAEVAESYPMTIESGDGEFTFDVLQEGADIVVSGTPDEMSYAVSADKYGLVLKSAQDAQGDQFDVKAQFLANDMTGNFSNDMAELRNIDYAISTRAIDLLFELNDENRITFGGKIDGLNLQSIIAMPIDFDDEQDFFKKGFAFQGGYKIDSAAYIFDVDAEGQTAVGSLTNGEISLDGKFDNDQFSYAVETNDIALSATGSELPVPVEFNIAKYAIQFLMPTSKTEDPTDFSMKIDILDVMINNEIWDLGDPGQILPREGATLQLDLVGKAKMLFDLLDPEQAELLDSGEAPGELHALTLNNFNIAAAGANVTGKGDFTFDNSDMTSFDGIPRPEGTGSVEINGLNALLDDLVEMGLIPEEQVGMGRLMIGAFLQSTGDDQLTSTLEINEQGQVLANGQRIK